MGVIDTEFSKLNHEDRTALEKVRMIVHKTVPSAEEVITYGMPGYKYKGKYLISFGAFKDHLSIFPGSETIAAHKALLKNYQTSKGTIKFTKDNQLSDELLRKIILLNKRIIDESSD
jgi:uncharacterized protein YdhG (YjbR/CyaY superfamily)